ncbi:MAG: WGR domain-containing protein [Gemmataceae bacterium]|nr:WGR domain-containing protein [Gemmataceae bacterium]
MSANPVEVVFSFDTTGSMYPCLTQVRRNVKNTVTRLFEEVPGIKVGVIAHGDYCDKGSTYVTKHLRLTDKAAEIVKFVETVGQTGGGDAPECYELVLREAQDHPWSAGATKCLVVIGDEVPHPKAHNPGKIDWREECKALAEAGIAVYGVQALNRKHAESFYAGMAKATGGFHVPLDQFSFVTDMVLAVCFRQQGTEQLEAYEKEVTTQGRMNRSLGRIFTTMLGKAPAAAVGEADLKAVPAGRFQVLEIDEDAPIKKFVEDNGLAFKKGRGFYEFTKKETIQGYKEIILMDKVTGDFFAGDRAREMLGLSPGETGNVRPTDLDKYAVFVQSTSVNRNLQKGTRFLYEVDDWDRAAEASAEPVEAAPVAAGAAAKTKKPAAAVATVAAPAPAPAGGGSKRRRFEFVEGSSSKFWEVWTEGSKMYTQYGRIGSTGSITEKPCADEAAARKAAEKLIGEKTGKGYKEK